MDLRIGHLYPDLMSIYGDRGNVIALSQRAAWRGIDVETRTFTAGETRFDPDWADVYFFGGGQDQGQDLVGADLAGDVAQPLQQRPRQRVHGRVVQAHHHDAVVVEFEPTPEGRDKAFEAFAKGALVTALTQLCFRQSEGWRPLRPF